MVTAHFSSDKIHPIKMNSFQRMMLKWNALTPYNAGHVIHITGNPDVKRWEKITLEIIQEMKLGNPHFIQNEKYVQFKLIDSLSVETPQTDLDTHINSELNRPFLQNEFPIRFFILQQYNHSYYFGAIYNHWIADSYAMRALFQRIFQRYQNMDSSLLPLTLSAPSFQTLFHNYLGKFPRLRVMKEFIVNLIYYQSVYRIKLNDCMDFKTGFSRYYLTEGLINNLYRYAKSQHVSINDIFLTALAKTIGQYTHDIRAIKKRKKLRFFPRNRLVLGTIVDIRPQVQDQVEYVFGQYLSNYTVLLKKPEELSFSKLLQNIANQTLKIKNTFKTIKNFARWDISLFLWKFLSKPRSQARFFMKNAPVIAGISNVNLTHSWIGKNSIPQSDTILDYIRISPTGLLLPLVFTLTTLHQRLSLCVSYRTTAFSSADVDTLSHKFMECLTELIDLPAN